MLLKIFITTTSWLSTGCLSQNPTTENGKKNHLYASHTTTHTCMHACMHTLYHRLTIGACARILQVCVEDCLPPFWSIYTSFFFFFCLNLLVVLPFKTFHTGYSYILQPKSDRCYIIIASLVLLGFCAIYLTEKKIQSSISFEQIPV